MKITILKNYVQNNDSLVQGLAQAKKLCDSINFPLEFTFKETAKKLTALPLTSDVVARGYMVDPQPILDSVDGSEDIACMIYDWSRVTPQPTNPVTSWLKKINAVPMQIPEQWYGYPKSYPEVLAQYFLHELCHAIAFLTGSQDLTHFQQNNPLYSQKTPIDYYLYLIKNLTPAWNKYKIMTVPTYTYFKPISDPLMVGISDVLMKAVDKARGLAGVPFRITSGKRTIEQNKSVGGQPNSAHLRGLALDFDCQDNAKRSIMTKAFLNCGTPLFIELANKHIHVDIDSSIHAMNQLIICDDE